MRAKGNAIRKFADRISAEIRLLREPARRRGKPHLPRPVTAGAGPHFVTPRRIGASDAISGCAVSRAARKARCRGQIPADFRVHRISERHYPDNSFEPGPADRQQPTTFLPGHWRFQYVMVVGPEFDGKLRWTLSHAGTSTRTSQNMLQYSWELDSATARQALRAIDPAKAPRGVCLNRPPFVRVLGLVGGGRGPASGLSVAVSEELCLFGSVADEGLPRGAPVGVSWKQLSGPGTVRFADPNTARTRASFSAPGAYELELWASDSVLEGRTKVVVTVGAASSPQK